MLLLRLLASYAFPFPPPSPPSLSLPSPIQSCARTRKILTTRSRAFFWRKGVNRINEESNFLRMKKEKLAAQCFNLRVPYFGLISSWSIISPIKSDRQSRSYMYTENVSSPTKASVLDLSADFEGSTVCKRLIRVQKFATASLAALENLSNSNLYDFAISFSLFSFFLSFVRAVIRS